MFHISPLFIQLLFTKELICIDEKGKKHDTQKQQLKVILKPEYTNLIKLYILWVTSRNLCYTFLFNTTKHSLEYVNNPYCISFYTFCMVFVHFAAVCSVFYQQQLI